MKTCFVSVVALLVTMAQAKVSFKPTTLIVKSNFEFGLVRKEFRVQYGGVDDCKDVNILIMKDEEQVIKFSVPKDDVATGKAYYFAKQDAKPGQYSVKVCEANDDKKCSEESKALTELLSDTDKPKLKCNSKEIYYPSGTGFMDKGTAANFTGSTMTKRGFTENPQAKNGTLYAAVEYPIHNMTDLFHSPSLDNSTIDCQGQYLFFTNLHLVNQTTEEVKYRMRYYLIPMPDAWIKMYVLNDTRPAYLPIENAVDHEGGIATGEYDLWVSFCATEKARLDSTVCSDPLVKKNFNVAE